MTKPIALFYRKYQQVIPNPLVQSAALFFAGLPIAYGVRNIIRKPIRSLSKDKRIAALTGLSPSLLLGGIDLTLLSFINKHGIPILAAAAPALLSAAVNMDVDKPDLGMLKWSSLSNKMQLIKKASDWLTAGYQPQLDFSQMVNGRSAKQLFDTNPYLQNSSYAQNLGTSIIAATPSYGNQMSIGNIYDSAVDKFDTKLKFQGLGGSVLRGAIAGSLAGMFTDVVGTVIGMPDPLRTSLANSVGVGKALYLILT